MKEYVTFECEICGYQSTNKRIIQICEDRGVPTKPIIGTIYQTAFCGRDITFAVSGDATIDGHRLEFGAWAARDNGNGDNLPGQTSLCAGAPPEEWKSPDQDCPTYKRLVQALRDVGIEPRPFRGAT